MKVQQLLQGTKASQARAASRSARSIGDADAKSADFAEALAGARKKPEPKPSETETPAAKKPAPASKKKQATKEQAEAPADDAVTAQEVAADDAQPLPTSEHDDVSAETEQPVATKDGETEKDSDLVKVDADLTAITMTPNMGPQAPAAAEVEQANASDDSHPNPMPICPTPKPQGRAVPVVDTVAAEQAPDELADVSDDVAGTILEGFEDLIDEPAEGEDLDAAQTAAARTPTATAARGPSIFSDDSPDVVEPVATDTDESAEPLPLPTISSEFAVADSVDIDDEMSRSPAAPVSKDATATLTPTQVQPEPAKAQATAPHAPAAPPPPPQAQFAEVNHPKIVTAMRGELLPHGGTMQIRLDPPELGALQVLVHMQDGVMTASFQTSNDDATKLLSHSLSQLKAVLESQGVSVEKLQVQQSPRDHQAQQDDPNQQQRDQQGDAHRQEQQRKEMLRRMWRKLSIGSDPLDLVA